MPNKKQILLLVRDMNALDDVYIYIKNNVLKADEVTLLKYRPKTKRSLRGLKKYIFLVNVISLNIKKRFSAIIMIDESASRWLTPMLKKTLKIPIINLSHSKVGSANWYYNINFSYYMVYGELCRKKLIKESETFHTKIVPIGPFLSSIKVLMSKNINCNYKTIKYENNFKKSICFTSQWWEKGKSDLFMYSYENFQN